MAGDERYTKTEKGAEEISKRRKNLPQRMRTMLILVDPSKTAAELATQAAQLGVPADFLQTLMSEGFIAPVGAAGAAAPGAGAHGGDGSGDELARFRKAQAFMNETIVNALGIRAFMFTLKLEHCSTRADLTAVVPDYVKALRKGTDDTEARVLVDRLRELLR
jgi:hypothetical protein